jgi:hypothetical protein
MEKKKECRIVEDLLPNYIEGLTNEVSNEFIETHLKECSACKIGRQRMIDELEVKVVHNKEKEIDFMKAYRRKMNILKGIIGVIIILEIIFLGDLVRKFLVINKYKIQMEQKNPENYYIKLINNEDKTFIESWTKEDTSLNKIILEDREQIRYSDAENAWLIINDKKEKIAIKMDRNKMGAASISIGYDSIFMENIWEAIQYAFNSKVTSEVYKGIECYRVYKNEYEQTYINKEDFRPIRIVNGSTDYSYEYVINEVTDEQVEFPDISGYEIRDDTNQ